MLRLLFALSLSLPLTVHALDIVEVLQLAEQHDALYQAAQANYLAGIEDANISDGALLPQLSFNAFGSQTRSSTSNSASASTPNGDSSFGAWGYSFNLSQTIYDRSLLDAASAESARAAAALAEFEAARQDLNLRVAESYFDLVAAQDALQLANAEQRAIARQLEQNRQRFNAGLVASTDVKESQARYDLAVADSIAAENVLDNSREALRLLIEQPVTTLGGLSAELPLVTPEPDDIDNWEQQARDNNLKLLASRYTMDAARDEYGSSRAEHYPTLSLDAEHSFTSSDGSTISNAFSGRDVDENRITLNLDLPLYEGGATRAGARKKRAEYDAARAEHRQQQRITTQLVRSAFLNIKASISRVKALKQALGSTQLAFEATQAGFDAGKRTSVDVLLAQREQFASEIDYRKARYDYILNVLRLKHASGILDGEDLLRVNQYISDDSNDA